MILGWQKRLLEERLSFDGFYLRMFGPDGHSCAGFQYTTHTWQQKTESMALGLLLDCGVVRFNHTNGIDLIGRAHQLVMEGYKWMFSEDGENLWVSGKPLPLERAQN